jgi:Domain of unknown function (DUF4145)
MIRYAAHLSVQNMVAMPLNARCPACRHQSAFDVIGQDFLVPEKVGNDIPGTYVYWGARRCPNLSCGAVVLVARTDHTPWEMFPAETIDFDASDLPESVVSALDEAITCHAHDCYVAAAIMVRKTLEIVCDDRGATGNNLYERITDLGNQMLMPQPMRDALHDLRLLGNDAAHIESQVYNGVGAAEVEAAIALTKEVLKATYQYESIMGRLKALKKDSSP